jgi:hypothetical protein
MQKMTRILIPNTTSSPRADQLADGGAADRQRAIFRDEDLPPRQGLDLRSPYRPRIVAKQATSDR